MRLLILTQKVDRNDDNLGFFHHWVEEFARQCEKVTVVCLFEGAHSLPENVRVLSLGKESGTSRLKYLRRFYAFAWKERKNYDAVFVHMNQIYVILGAPLWRLLGKCVGLWYAHGTV
ncbi:MAG TPA: glycosyltransferase, partial [Candidatus Paceibacterota bacterium]|nr:glycosyltransferase [Candidatus Paceibacterota bacterium]